MKTLHQWILFCGIMLGLMIVQVETANGCSGTYSPSNINSLAAGPYWVDQNLNRTDITGSQQGLPLTLTILVYNATSSCSATPNVQVDVWHCNASGSYSDGTSENWLRGYQTTDSQGSVTFTTIYPGWYSGRTVHISVRIRVFDGYMNLTYEDTTEFFFEDSLTDTIYASVSPYNATAARDTRNSDDSVFNTGSNYALNLTGETTTGYVGTARLFYPFVTSTDNSTNTTNTTTTGDASTATTTTGDATTTTGSTDSTGNATSTTTTTTVDSTTTTSDSTTTTTTSDSTTTTTTATTGDLTTTTTSSTTDGSTTTTTDGATATTGDDSTTATTTTSDATTSTTTSTTTTDVTSSSAAAGAGIVPFCLAMLLLLVL